MSIKCPICGAPLQGSFCEYCGYRMESGSAGKKKSSEGSAAAQQRRSLEDLDREIRAESAASGQKSTYQKQQAWMPRQTEAQPVYASVRAESRYSRLTASLLCFFFGVFGVHRFYVRKIGSGLLWLLTFGLFGLGWLVDIIMLLTGTFTDDKGLPLKTW